MSKLFKVGDKVQRTKKIDGKIMRGVIVTKRPGLAIDIKLTEGAGNYAAGDIYGGSIYFWDVVEQPDDELPPVPTSVLYNDEYPHRQVYDQTWLRLTHHSVENLVTISTGQYGHEDRGVGVRISADAALQLAHDLRRMAMDVRRKERAKS